MWCLSTRSVGRRNYRAVSPTLVLEKIMEQIILSVITWYILDNQGIRPVRIRFRKGKSCLPT